MNLSIVAVLAFSLLCYLKIAQCNDNTEERVVRLPEELKEDWSVKDARIRSNGPQLDLLKPNPNVQQKKPTTKGVVGKRQIIFGGYGRPMGWPFMQKWGTTGRPKTSTSSNIFGKRQMFSDEINERSNEKSEPRGISSFTYGLTDMTDLKKYLKQVIRKNIKM